MWRRHVPTHFSLQVNLRTFVKLGDESSQSFCSAEGARRLHPWQPPAAGDDSPAARARSKHSGDGKAAARWPRRQAEDRVAQGQSWHARNDNGASASVGRLRPQFFFPPATLIRTEQQFRVRERGAGQASLQMTRPDGSPTAERGGTHGAAPLSKLVCPAGLAGHGGRAGAPAGRARGWCGSAPPWSML